MLVKVYKWLVDQGVRISREFSLHGSSGCEVDLAGSGLPTRRGKWFGTVSAASPKEPYLGIVIEFDLAIGFLQAPMADMSCGLQLQMGMSNA
jgi:hypothetical protein